jgi:putative phosphoribosyl transferase
MGKTFIADRREGGLLLAEKLVKYKNKNVIVLAIPRGGVVTGAAIAKCLNFPLDIVLSKKIPHPLNPEFAIGSIASDVVLLDPANEVPKNYIEKEIERIKEDLIHRHKALTGKENFPNLRNKTVIVVDDGIATGNTLLAAIEMLRNKAVAKIVVAVPVVPFDRVKKISDKADEFIYLQAPGYFPGVGAFYRNFDQVSDEVVKHLLEENKHKLEEDQDTLENSILNDFYLF